jgi:hypothetical protein
MATHPDLNTDAHSCDVACFPDHGRILGADLQGGNPVGGGVVGNFSFLIPRSSFTTRQSKALVWRQAQ